MTIQERNECQFWLIVGALVAAAMGLFYSLSTFLFCLLTILSHVD